MLLCIAVLTITLLWVIFQAHAGKTHRWSIHWINMYNSGYANHSQGIAENHNLIQINMAEMIQRGWRGSTLAGYIKYLPLTRIIIGATTSSVIWRRLHRSITKYWIIEANDRLYLKSYWKSCHSSTISEATDNDFGLCPTNYLGLCTSTSIFIMSIK